MNRVMPRPPSAASRPILTCEQCRSLKLRCDKRKPICSRCLSSDRACHYLSQETNKESARSLTGRRRSPTASGTPSKDGESVCAEVRKYSIPLQSPWRDGQPNLDNIQNSPGSGQSSRSKSEEQNFVEPLPRLSRNSLPRKKSRAVVSCSRCRKSKVKCDRQNPCGRCWKYGHTCRYLPVDTPNNVCDAREAEPSALKSNFKNSRELWRAKHCAESHWHGLVHYARALLGKDGVSCFEVDDEQHSSAINLTLANYPFVACCHTVALSKTMPPRPITQLLVQRYFDTIGKLFWIMDLATFEVELQHFWEHPEEASPGWMAQLLLIMSLGCDSLNTVDGYFAASHGHLSHLFLDQANALLHQTPFMFRPDLCTIRSLCLMVLAKQILRKSCFEEDASWCLTGMIKRLAMSLNLHLDQPNNTSTHLESGMRKALWMTILYLDLRQSILSGLPILVEPLHISFAASSSLGSCDSLSSLSGESTPQITSHTGYEEAFQDIFYRALPLAHEVVLAARSVDCPYETAVRIDKEVREVLREVKQLPAEPAFSAPPHHRSDSSILQWEVIHLDTLFRRLLLELHRRFAYMPQAAVYYPVSHWSTLDCAAAMLVLQQSICENSDFTAGQWLSAIFRPDFFVAGLTVSVYLIQDSSPLDSPTLPGGYAQKTLLETLRSCRDIAARWKNTWICEFKKFEFLDQVITALDQTTV